MRKLTIIFLLLQMLLHAQNSYCQHKVMLCLPEVGAADTNLLYLSHGLNGTFLVQFVNEMSQYYPCIGITDPKSALLCMDELRLQATPEFGSRDVKKLISNIANSIANPDFAVKYSMYVNSEESVSAKVKCANAEGEILADFTMEFPTSELFEDANISPVDRLMDDLKKFEICPFTGSVTIEVKSEKDETTTDNGPAPCGGNRTTTMNIKNNGTLKWELNKYELRGASGTANYNFNENITIESNYSCYRCKNGSEGAAKITETQGSEASVEGLSNESISEGNKVDDARIKLDFLDDGTYTVLVEATSKQGVLKETSEKKVEGPCEDESEPKDTKNKKIDVPIKAVFGPYPGKPSDKLLQQKETKDVSQGQEKTTLTIDFTLTREN